MAAAGMLAVACPAAILAQPISAGWYEKLPKLLLRADIPVRNVDLMSNQTPDSYRIPLGDKRIANDERLRLTFK